MPRTEKMWIYPIFVGGYLEILTEKSSAGVNYQMFVNHGDVEGGSTLGNKLTVQLDIRGVDMGAAIWAMHSARETAGVSDHLDTVKVFTTFFS